MKVIHFMNEVPVAFPSALVSRIQKHDDVEAIIVSYYDDIASEICDYLPVISLNAEGQFDFRAFRKFREILLTQEPDILHTHPNGTGSIARLVAATTKVKIVDTRHNDHRHFPFYRRVPNLLATSATGAFISNSKNTQESFSNVENLILRISGGHHKVVYNGIDSERVRDLPPDPIELPDGPRIICVARYVPQKNHETLVRSMDYVRESIPGAKLILVGKGPRFQDVASLVSELGLEETVVQTGYLPQRVQVLSAVANSDIFAISSWYEGFCIAAVEAMLAETPVVASDLGVLREVVGEAGVFADPADPKAFADCITRLLKDESRRDELGAIAGQRAQSIFSLDRTAEGYVRVYHELMADD